MKTYPVTKWLLFHTEHPFTSNVSQKWCLYILKSFPFPFSSSPSIPMSFYSWTSHVTCICNTWEARVKCRLLDFIIEPLNLILKKALQSIFCTRVPQRISGYNLVWEPVGSSNILLTSTHDPNFTSLQPISYTITYSLKKKEKPYSATPFFQCMLLPWWAMFKILHMLFNSFYCPGSSSCFPLHLTSMS